MEIEEILVEALVEAGFVDNAKEKECTQIYITDRPSFNQYFGDDAQEFPVAIIDSTSLNSLEPMNTVNHFHSEWNNITILFLEKTHFDDLKREMVEGAIQNQRQNARRFLTKLSKNSNLRGQQSLTEFQVPTTTPLYNLFDVELSGVMLILGVKLFDNFESC